MPSSATRAFGDAGDYAAAIRATSAEITLTAPGVFSAALTRIDLHHLWLQRFSDNLPRIGHSAAPPGRTGVSFRNRPGPGLYWNRTEMRFNSVIHHGDGHDVYQRSEGSADWGAMTLPVERMAAFAVAIAGRDLGLPGDERAVTPPPAAMARLLRLHATAGLMAETAPAAIANPNSAQGLEHALIEAMVGCLDGAEAAAGSAAGRRHDVIMRRFRATIADHPDQAIYLADICAATGVAHRTLHLCCHESLGMGPKRYLVLRRLALARQALRCHSRPRTVTEIATRFGFWNFGRFAAEYRLLFNETPSATLRQPPAVDRSNTANAFAKTG